MKKNIDNYIAAIENDNKEYICEGGYNSVADYIVNNAENGTGWVEFFDDDELADNVGQEPSSEQVEELKDYVRECYNYLPAAE